MIKKWLLSLFRRPWMDYYASEKAILVASMARKYGEEALESKVVKIRLHKAAKDCAKARYKEVKRGKS